MTDVVTIATAALACGTVSGCLAMTLRHLAAMRVTSGEVTALRDYVAAHTQIPMETANTRLKALEDKVTAISNRIQSTR